MNDNTNYRERFADLEYVFEQYAKKNIDPLVAKGYSYVHLQQEIETRESSADSYMYQDALSPFHATAVRNGSGQWTQHGTELLYQKVFGDLQRDGKFRSDIQSMMSAWETLAKEKLGVDGYKVLCEKAGGNAAVIYFEQRIQQRLMESMAQKNVPKGTLDYVFSKGVANSFAGWLASPDKTPFDKHLEAVAEKIYNPSFLEKMDAGLVTFLTDAVSFGGYGRAVSLAGKSGMSLVKGAATNTGRYLFAGGDFYLSLREGFNSNKELLKRTPLEMAVVEEDISNVLFGSKDSLSRCREASAKKSRASSQYVREVASVLSRPCISLRYSSREHLSDREKVYKLLEGNGDTLKEFTDRMLETFGVKVRHRSSVPQYMQRMSHQELLATGSWYIALAKQMYFCHLKKIDVGGKSMTYQEVCQQAADYAHAAAVSQQSQSSQATQQQTVDYSSSHEGYEHQAASHVDNSDGRSQQGATAPSSVSTGGGGTRDDDMSGDTRLDEQSRKAVGSWEPFFKDIGLSGFSDVGHNIGYVLGMLPELVIGLFTGQLKGVSLKDNLLPIAAIFAGMFSKNPLMKLFMIGFGGVSLLNKAGQGLLGAARGDTHTPCVTYRRYDDEPLDRRIGDPVIKGNSLIAAIDGVPMVITLDDSLMDSHQLGYVPFNTLCNAVLRKYDEQRESVHQQYEEDMARHQSHESSMRR